MKILITGASGFIGGFLVEEALKKGWEVWAGVRSSSNLNHLADPNIHLIDLNYENPARLKLQITAHGDTNGAWDYIIHNAGVTKCANEADYIRINHQYTLHFISALIESGNKPSKFVYMSSLGAVGPGDEKSGKPVSMSDKPNPISEYGRSKLLAENYIRGLSDFPWIILRPTGVYGPRERDYYLMLKMINAGFNVAVGLKEQRLNFIYIKDLVSVCFASLESPLCQKTWFVADGDFYTSSSFASLLRAVLRKRKLLSMRIPLPLVKVVAILSGTWSQLTGKPSVMNSDKYKVMKHRNWTCDASDLEQELPFKAEFNLHQGMEETVSWYKKNGWLK